jgi:hypothetical protein
MPHDLLRQRRSNTHQDEQRPLPAERIDHNHKHKPIDQLCVSEELKSTRGSPLLDEPRKINPELHRPLIRPRQWIHEKHEQEARVDANMVVADGADGVDVGTSPPTPRKGGNDTLSCGFEGWRRC